jgi:hypothetical protein
LNFQEVLLVIERAKSERDIPIESRLYLVEKRYIELPEDPNEEAKIWDELVWIGEYVLESSLFEIALNMEGKVVRVRKSR